jgi:hypothetical protein
VQRVDHNKVIGIAIMQFPTSGIVGSFFFLLWISQVQFIVAEDKVVVVSFNNGTAPSSTHSCSSLDNGIIDNLFYWASLSRRNLRGVETMPNATSILEPVDFYKYEEAGVRNLAYSSKCKDACAGYATGTCRAIGCVGYRRTLEHEDHDEKRKLQDAICDRVIGNIHSGLNNLITTNAVSNTCKAFIDPSKRKYTCYGETVFGQIDTLKIWNVGNAASPVLMTNVSVSALPYTTETPTFQSAYSFCKSRKITAEVVGNDCIDVLTFHLYKVPNTWGGQHVHVMDDYAAPFLMYGTDAYGRMNGTLLPVGQYMMDVKPNWYVAKEKRFMFTVLNC